MQSAIRVRRRASCSALARQCHSPKKQNARPTDSDCNAEEGIKSVGTIEEHPRGKYSFR